MPSQAPCGVGLSTIHGAKGREWRAVLIVRANDDVIPLSHHAADGEECLDAEQLAEERRLLYVAMTRAKERLFIGFVMNGPDNVPAAASRFLRTIPDTTVIRTNHFDLQQKRVTQDTGGAGFAQRSDRGSSGMDTPLRPEEQPTGKLAAKLAYYQQASAHKKQKAAESAAKKAAKKAASTNETSGKASQSHTSSKAADPSASGNASSKRPAAAPKPTTTAKEAKQAEVLQRELNSFFLGGADASATVVAPPPAKRTRTEKPAAPPSRGAAAAPPSRSAAAVPMRGRRVLLDEADDDFE